MPKTEKKAFISRMGFRRIYLIFFLFSVFSSASCSESDAGIVSDDFDDKTLDEIWTFIDPVGDASMELVGAGTEDAHLLLSVPEGSSHDVWTEGNRSARVMQSAADADFEVEAKFESQPTEKHQIQGLLVEQDAGNFLRFDVYSDGNNLNLFAAHFINGSPTAVLNQTVIGGPTTYLRVTRQGNQWTLHYGHDGNWIAETSFAHPLTVSAVGVFVGNSGSNPAYTAVVDYFFNTEKPIVPEDGAKISYD